MVERVRTMAAPMLAARAEGVRAAARRLGLQPTGDA
jgi:hypothetical protein